MNKKQPLLLLFLLIINKLWAQQSYPVTDAQPVLINGLNIGYDIKSQEVKEVKGKGNFSRYAVRFYVTNMDNVEKIIRHGEGWQADGDVSDQLAQFNILNATGARFTSNAATVKALPYNVVTFDRDRSTNNISQNRRLVQVGYRILPGQTISVDEIVIVPLNQLPNVQVVYLAGSLHPAERALFGDRHDMVQNTMLPSINIQGFLKIKSVFNNTYINIQTDVPTSSGIDHGWWSAQWQLLPIEGTNYFNIKNRWKGNFLDTDRGYIIISLNPQSAGCMWSIEPTQDLYVFMIKNAQTGGYLSIGNNNLMLSNIVNNDFSSAWQLEQP